MRRYIRANRYADTTSKELDWISYLGRNLADVCEAQSSEEVEQILKPMGRIFSIAGGDKAKAIEAIIQNMEWHLKEYRSQQSMSNKYPDVESKVLQAAQDFGFSIYKMDSGSYRLADPYEADHKTLNEFCQYLKDTLGVRWDTGLYGSWTAHSGSLDGIFIHVGFEYDEEYDPSGRTTTLQLEF